MQSCSSNPHVGPGALWHPSCIYLPVFPEGGQSLSKRDQAPCRLLCAPFPKDLWKLGKRTTKSAHFPWRLLLPVSRRSIEAGGVFTINRLPGRSKMQSGLGMEVRMPPERLRRWNTRADVCIRQIPPGGQPRWLHRVLLPHPSPFILLSGEVRPCPWFSLDVLEVVTHSLAISSTSPEAPSS